MCVCVNEGFGSVQAVITGTQFLGVFHKQVNFPNILPLYAHSCTCVCTWRSFRMESAVEM